MKDRTSAHPRRIQNLSPVHTNPFYIVTRQVAQFDGISKGYIVSEHGERVGLVVVKDENVLLVRQYRLLINDLSRENTRRRSEGE